MEVTLTLRFRIVDEERLRLAYRRLLEIVPDLGTPAEDASVGEMTQAVVSSADTLALAVVEQYGAGGWPVSENGWLDLGLERLQSEPPRTDGKPKDRPQESE